MPVIQAIQSVAGRTGGGGGGPPPPVQADFFWAADQDSWLAFGGFYTSGIFSDPAPANPSFTYLDGSYTGKTRDFTGTQFMVSPNLGVGNAWQTNTISINLWFYPTTNGVQLLGEYDSQLLNGYRYTVLEIDSTNHVKAVFWHNTNGDAITSTNTVTLNKWNHIYFAEDSQGGHVFELNGVATTGNPVYTRQGPGSTTEYFAIGDICITNMGNSGRFQGKLGYLTINDYVAGSTYTSSYSKFKANSTVRNGVVYTLTPKINGDANVTTANPGDVISWTIDSNPSEAGKTIIWWVDGNAVPVNTWVENPYYNSTGDAGIVTLDANGSATWSLTVVAVPPVHASFRLYISESLYQGWLTHSYLSV